MGFPNWFKGYAADYFEHHLRPLAGRPGLRFLQIGVYTGDATLWLFDNILTGTGCTLTDVDTWEGSGEPEHEAIDFREAEQFYDDRTAHLGGLWKYKGTSLSFLRATSSTFDFIYVDGDHTAAGVLADAVHAIPLLKLGGLIAFDDYLWQSGGDRLTNPGPAIDAIADLYSDRLARLVPLRQELQVWFRKTAV